MNKGFTLMELLGVIVILALLMILLVPNVLEQINNKKGEVSKAEEEAIKAAAELYVDEHPNEYANNTSYCICITTLKAAGKLSDNITTDVTGNKYSDTYGVEIINKEATGLKDCGNCN